jgi:hypothetical protein
MMPTSELVASSTWPLRTLRGHVALVSLERDDDTCGEMPDPPPSVGLRQTADAFTACQLDRLLGHGQGLVHEIQVALPHAGKLSPPAASVRGGQHQRPVAPFDRVGDRRDLRRADNTGFLGPFEPGFTGAPGRTRTDVASTKPKLERSSPSATPSLPRHADGPVSPTRASQRDRSRQVAPRWPAQPARYPLTPVRN